MYETLRDELLTRAQFTLRVLWHFSAAIVASAIALLAGVLGYRFFGGLSWVDALLNASMILGGMGPVDPLKTDGAKIFASFYALFSGLVFIGLLGLLLAPFIHRVLHKLHLESVADEQSGKDDE
jgi:hypothetical protein